MVNLFRERWHGFSAEQKVAACLLFVCAGLAAFVSVYQIHDGVRRPFRVSKAQLVEAKKVYGETDAQKEERLRRIDTDGDGLSDWEEANTYALSPNLRDTCGDGIPDNIRVATGKNLTCANQPAFAGGLDVSALQASSSGMALPFIDAGAKASAAARAPAVAPNGSLADFPRDPAFIREALKDSVSAEQLQNVTDDQLLRLYDQAMGQASANVASTSTTP